MPSTVKIIIGLLFFFFFSINSALAESSPPENCEIRAFDKGRLWQVKKPNAPPSHVFGTMHSKDPRILFLPGIIMQAFTSSAVVILETSLKSEQLENSRAMMVGSGSYSLRNEIGDQRFQQLQQITPLYGLTPPALDKLKIWAVAAILSQPPQPRNKTDKSLTLLDRELERSAHQMKKVVFPLETMQEQLSLFDRMDRNLQIEYLDQALKGFSELDFEIEKISNHYLSGHTGWIYCDLETSLETVSSSLSSFMTDDLIDERNRKMVNRMMPLLDKGHAFVAIGALHLPGELGVLSLLEKQGFKVKRKF